MIFLHIAGGIALIIFGIRFLRKGLDRLFGGSFASWLARDDPAAVESFRGRHRDRNNSAQQYGSFPTVCANA